MNESLLAIDAIRKKLEGKKLDYNQIYSIMDQISHKRLGRVLMTYFAASGYSQGFKNEEIYHLTKAMIETGERLEFPGIVADKHSIGGVPGTRTTLIVTPIVASAGFTIPKSSSRAITTPGGTADDMETLSPVAFNKEEIEKIVKKTNACIVWGGGVDIAPADDELIKIEEPLRFESFDKILVSVMAKKIAFGSNHIVIELPYGKHVKLRDENEAEVLKRKFEYLAERFNIKLKAHIHKTEEPAGRGIGPNLEVKDALMVLEQDGQRPLDLEKRALNLAGILLDLCLEDADSDLRRRINREFGSGFGWADYILKSGHARRKMKSIIKAQGGDPDIKSEKLKTGKYSFEVKAEKKGEVKSMNCRNISTVAKVLGAPKHKKSGIFLNKKLGEGVEKEDVLFTLYSENEYELREGKDTLNNFPILEY